MFSFFEYMKWLSGKGEFGHIKRFRLCILRTTIRILILSLVSCATTGSKSYVATSTSSRGMCTST